MGVLKWSIMQLLSTFSIHSPSCEKACPRKCQARCPCQNGGICKGKGICDCPPGWTVCCQVECLAHSAVICGRCQIFKFTLSSLVVDVPAGSQLWTRRFFFKKKKKRWFISKDISEGNLSSLEICSCKVFQLCEKLIMRWGFFLLLEDVHERSHDCTPTREHTHLKTYFVGFSVQFLQRCIHFHLAFVFIPLCRVKFAQNVVQKEGLDQTVLGSVPATTGANVTLKMDSVSVPKVSLV